MDPKQKYEEESQYYVHPDADYLFKEGDYFFYKCNGTFFPRGRCYYGKVTSTNLKTGITTFEGVRTESGVVVERGTMQLINFKLAIVAEEVMIRPGMVVI